MRIITEKYCVKCKRTRPIKYFYPMNRKILGQSKYCDECLDLMDRNVTPASACNKRRRKTIRKKVIDILGGRCECCGEDRIEFLALDHVNGDGNKLRREKFHPRGSDALYTWIIKNEDHRHMFRILCHNCNMSRGFYGYCPHEQSNM